MEPKYPLYYPLKFWFINTPEYLLPIAKPSSENILKNILENTLENTFRMCACSTYDISVMKPDNAPTIFLAELCRCIDFSREKDSPLGNRYPIVKPFPDDHDIDEVQYCLTFLAMDQELRANFTLWTFISNFLGIVEDSSFDYLLMNYLEHMGYIEHGVGIRCAWLSVKTTPRKEELIRAWLQKADTR